MPLKGEGFSEQVLKLDRFVDILDETKNYYRNVLISQYVFSWFKV